MSQYVKRCDTCRKVRGVSAFTVYRTSGGGRSETCRWCEQEAQYALDQGRAANRKRVVELRRLEGQYVRRLADVRAELAEREALLVLKKPENVVALPSRRSA